MLTCFIIKCIIQIEDTIDTPPSGSFVKNNSAIRLCFRRIGSTINEYIHLSTRKEAAAFLKKHGIIHSFKVEGEEVIMNRMEIVTRVFKSDKRSVPFQFERELPVTWEELFLTRSIVQTIAAREEFEVKARIIGLAVAVDYVKDTTGKVVEFTSKIFKAA